jgi:hypothetical protein
LRTVLRWALLFLALLWPEPGWTADQAPEPDRAGGADEAYLAELLNAARRQGLHRETQWLRLGHYRRSILTRGYKSQVDGQAFFLAPNGQRDAEQELAATLASFFAPDPADPNAQHPQCQFPARYAWLTSKLAFDARRLPEKRCPRYEAFRDRVTARSVTLVFSSYYLNNPSSAFGHTFLRLNKTEHGFGGRRLDLMDYGVEYAATVDTGNAILYAFKGLTGGFKGEWTHYPYYYKVRLYNDYEKRDIWEYDLNIEPQRIEMLVAHLWELGATHFNYFYISENCSYHILTLLEAADPTLELVSHVPYYVIPADTVKALYANPGLVREARYRPSIWTQFEHRMARLAAAQKAALEALAEEPDAPLPPELGPTEQAEVLDAALDHVDARYARGLLLGAADPLARKQRLLERRSEIRTVTPELRIETPVREMPQVGHGSGRAGIASGYSDRLGFFEQLDFRLALHDLVDPPEGYPKHAQIEFLSTRLRHNVEAHSVWLDDFALFRVVSLSPLTAFDRQLSWKVEAGATTIRDESCRDCLAGTFEVGGGLAQAFFESPGLIYFLTADAEVAASPGFRGSDVRLGVGPTGGVQLSLGRRFSSLATASWKYLALVDLDRSHEFGVTNRWHVTRAFSLSLEGRRYPTAWEGALGILYYF